MKKNYQIICWRYPWRASARYNGDTLIGRNVIVITIELYAPLIPLKTFLEEKKTWIKDKKSTKIKGWNHASPFHVPSESLHWIRERMFVYAIVGWLLL